MNQKEEEMYNTLLDQLQETMKNVNQIIQNAQHVFPAEKLGYVTSIIYRNRLNVIALDQLRNKEPETPIEVAPEEGKVFWILNYVDENGFEWYQRAFEETATYAEEKIRLLNDEGIDFVLHGQFSDHSEAMDSVLDNMNQRKKIMMDKWGKLRTLDDAERSEISSLINKIFGNEDEQKWD